MQYPMPKPVILPSSTPGTSPTMPATPQGQQNQNPAGGSNVSIDPTQRFRAWYPRWWLLSAIFCGVPIGAILLLQWAGCKGSFAPLPVCQFDNWSDWRQLPVVAIAWVIFLSGWLMFYIFYVTPIEFRHPRAAWPQFLASLSHTRAAYSSIYIYGMVAICAIMAMWLRNDILPLPFALCSMILLVANAQYFHRIPRQTRRQYLAGYGIIAFAGIIAMLITGKHQLVLFSFEVVLVLIGGWATYTRFRHPWDDPDQNLQVDPAELVAIQNEKALETGAIARRLLEAMFPFLKRVI